jgi:hypothetical protein
MNDLLYVIIVTPVEGYGEKFIWGIYCDEKVAETTFLNFIKDYGFEKSCLHPDIAYKNADFTPTHKKITYQEIEIEKHYLIH